MEVETREKGETGDWDAINGTFGDHQQETGRLSTGDSEVINGRLGDYQREARGGGASKSERADWANKRHVVRIVYSSEDRAGFCQQVAPQRGGGPCDWPRPGNCNWGPCNKTKCAVSIKYRRATQPLYSSVPRLWFTVHPRRTIRIQRQHLVGAGRPHAYVDAGIKLPTFAEGEGKSWDKNKTVLVDDDME